MSKKKTLVVETPAVPVDISESIKGSSLDALKKIQDAVKTQISQLLESEAAQKKQLLQEVHQQFINDKKDIVNKLRKRLKSIHEQYESLSKTKETIRFTATFDVKISILSEYELGTYEHIPRHPHCKVRDLFDFQTSADVVRGKLSIADAEQVNEATYNVFDELCSDGIRIVAPELGKKCEVIAKKFSDLFAELDAESLTIEDIMPLEKT
jgi:vacuolar-type H+-ATPase subunit I/STV1